jgi:beta-xylosidase
MEGQSILKKDNYYYLFYSAGNCCGEGCSYAVNVARAANFKGPYELFSGNPILSENDAWKCMGHGTFVDAENGNTYYLHHAYNKKSTVFTGREGLLSELSWQGQEGWPTLKTQPNSTATKADLYDDFDGRNLAKYWQWDFRHTTPAVKEQKGILHLSGTSTKENFTGIALTVRPTSDSFEITTTVANHNKALKGLVIYGDANAAIGIGVEGDSVKVWKVENKQRMIIKATKVPASAIGLKIAMSKGRICDFFYQTNKTTWVRLSSNIEARFLPQWDRSPRLGLHYSGNENEDAQFSYFGLHNK